MLCVLHLISIFAMVLFSSSSYFLRFWFGFEDGLGSHDLSRNFAAVNVELYT